MIHTEKSPQVCEKCVDIVPIEERDEEAQIHHIK